MAAPRPEDFTMSLNWSAQHAFNFMRGTEDWGYPYWVEIDSKRVRLDSAIAYSPVGALNGAYDIDGHYVKVRFAHGVLQAFSADPLPAQPSP
jgi:hypothetical protein